MNFIKNLFLGLLLSSAALGAQQSVNVGSAPNDHTGDPLRSAFIKLNANDAELYARSSIGIGFNVMDYGAFNDGTNLAPTTTAIQAAYTAACANVHGNATGGVVFFPPGEYKSGPIVETCAQVSTQGSGRGSTKITFVPSGNSNPTSLASGVADPGTWLTIANSTFTSSQPSIIYYGSISDLRISTTDLTSQKNAIYLAETSQFFIQRIAIDQFWGNNSVGVRIAGHEIFKMEDYFISATVPVWVDKGLVAYGGVKYDDSFQFINGYTRAPHGTDPASYYPSGIAGGVPNTNYFIADGVFASNWTWDRANWVGGANAIYWKQTTSSVSVNYKVSIHHGRKEQSGGANSLGDPIIGFVFDFDGAPQRLNDLGIEDTYVSGTHTDSGVYAHGVNQLLLKNFENSGYTADGLFVMDVSNVFTIKWINVDSAVAGNPSTINFNLNEGSLRNATFRQNCNLPRNGEWTFESAPRVTKTLAAGTTSNLATVFGVSSDIGGLDWPRGVKIVYLTTTAGAATLTGLPPPVSTTGLFTYGEAFELMNANGGNKLTLSHNSGSETTAAQRFECPLGQDRDILPGQSASIRYDFTLSRYVVQ